MPSKKGHFSNYVRIFSDYLGRRKIDERVVTKRSVFLYFKLAVGWAASGRKDYIFLHGERHLLLMLFIKVLSPKSSVKSIFYYGLYGGNQLSSIRIGLVLSVLKISGIQVFALEAAEALMSKFSYKRVVPLPDPVDLSINELVLQHDGIAGKDEFLIYGYLDDRKSILEVVDALENFYEKKVGRNARVTLLGEQSSDVEKLLESKQAKIGSVSIVASNHRFCVEELAESMAKANVVFAVYKDHVGSSGVVLESVLCNKNVIFVPVGVLKEFSKQLGIEQSLLPKSSCVADIEMVLAKVDGGNVKMYTDDARGLFLMNRSNESFCRILGL